MTSLLDTIEGHLVREEYADALPLLQKAKLDQPSPVIDSCIIKCMTEEKINDGLAELALEFATAGNVRTVNDMIIVFNALIQCEKFEEANNCLDLYLTMYPTSSDINEMKIKALFFCNRSEEFLEMYQEMIAVDSGETVDFSVHAAAATQLVAFGRHDDALEALARTPDSYGYIANNLYFDDRYTSAIETGKSASASHNERLVFSAGDVFPASSIERPCVFVSGDTGYIGTYFGGFYESFLQSQTDAHVHVHAMARSDEDLAAFLKIMASLPDNTSFTYEWIDRSRDGKEYFATARFLALNALYTRFGFRGKVFALDIDSHIRRNLAQVFDYFEDMQTDVALRLRHSLFLEQRVAAGALYLSASDDSQAYISDVAAYIAYGIYADTAYWYLDQLALYEVYDYYRRNKKDVSFTTIPAQFLDWEFGDKSLVWTTKGGKF